MVMVKVTIQYAIGGKNGSRRVALLVFNLGVRHVRAFNATSLALYSRVRASVRIEGKATLAARPVWNYAQEIKFNTPTWASTPGCPAVASLCTDCTVTYGATTKRSKTIKKKDTVFYDNLIESLTL
jgi:hypothetical protein